MTSRVRGPCTPSTRSSSMSLVADGPLIQVSGRPGSSRARASGTRRDDLLGRHQAQVVVGDEGQGAPSLARRSVEDDGARLGDRNGGAGDDAVHGVERGGGEAVVGDDVNTRGQIGHVEAGRHDDPAGAALPQRFADRGHDLAGRRAPDRAAVVAQPLGQQVEQLRGAQIAAGPVAAWHRIPGGAWLPGAELPGC